MNTTYTLTEGNDALNRVLLMMGYEMGKTLDEQKLPQGYSEFTPQGKQQPVSATKLKKYQQGEYENATRKYVDNTATTFRGADERQKTTATSPKITKDLNIKKLTFDEFMEEYRENLFSIGGMAIEAFLTATEFGAVPVTVAWGFLLWYDVNKGIETGNWDWANLIIDVLMVSSAGLLGFELKALVSSEKLVGKGLTDGVETLIKSNEGRNIIKELETLPTKSSSIKETMKAGLEWFSNSIVGKGANILGKAAIWPFKKAAQGIGYVLTKIGVLIDKISIIIEKQLNKVGVTGKLGKGLGAAGGITAFNLSIKAIEEIHNKWVQMGKEATLKGNNEKFLIEGNQKIYGKDIIYNYIDGKYTIKMKRDVNGIYYTYSDKYKEWQEVYPDEYTPEQLQSTIKSGLVGRTDLKFNEFEILDKKNNIYEINNNKYQLIPGDDFKLKKI
jgi:hypothetical protein